FPHDLHLTAPTDSESGQSLTISGNSEMAGECTVELVPDRGSSGNSTSSTIATQSVEPGPFQVTLLLPSDAAGQYTIRGFVSGKAEFAVGATSTNIRANHAPMISRAALEAIEK